MKINSSKLLFYSTMMIGIMMSTSANNWIMIWCGLEISMVSIIPLMISKSSISSESTIKYFIVQSISSAMLMLSVLIMIMKGDYNYDFTLMTALLMKMGVAPFHTWLLTVVEGLDLMMMLVTLTINKIAPLTIMSYTMKSSTMVIMLTVLTGSIMGLNQNSIKKMIGYSSIFNMGFIMSVIMHNWMWLYYLTVYSTLMATLISMLKKNKIGFINQISLMEFLTNKISIWLIMLSMGGVPPLVGFSIKYMTMLYMISTKMNLMITIMLMTSLIVMFFYLRITFVSMMNNSIMTMTKLFKLNNVSMLMMIVNISTMPTLMSMKMFI